MGMISFENFAKLSENGSGLSPTERAGRYSIQSEAEKLIVADVGSKLSLDPQDDLLDIGCGAGLLLAPLSALVRSATGIDHADIIKALNSDYPTAPFATIPGNFLDVDIDARYSAIVAYSVAHYMSSEKEVMRFIEKAAGLLCEGGRLLIGDIPNVDKKRRFLQTQTGAAFDRTWKKQTSKLVQTAAFLPDPDMVTFNDDLVLALISRFRSQGFDAFVLPQSHSLPLGHTREDILIVRPPR